MSETERTAITNGDDTTPSEVSVVETSTPGVYGIVVVNADGSSV